MRLGLLKEESWRPLLAAVSVGASKGISANHENVGMAACMGVSASTEHMSTGACIKYVLRYERA